MAPTFVFEPDGRLRLAVGRRAAPTIPTTVAQVISHLVDDGMTLSQAVSTPRIHHQWRPDAIQRRAERARGRDRPRLEARGHTARARPLEQCAGGAAYPEGPEAASDRRARARRGDGLGSRSGPWIGCRENW